MKSKCIEFIKKYRYIIIGAAAILAILLLVLLLIPSGDKEEIAVWGEGITENIPEFDGRAEIESGEGYTAAYYENVSGEQVEEYSKKLESVCGIEFSSNKYPRSAVYGDKMIVIHYNVTEMKLSVTVTAINAD